MQTLSQGANKCNSCGSGIKCRCSKIPNKSHHASSKRSLASDLRMCSAADATKLDCKGKSTLTSSQVSKSGSIQRSDGAVSALVPESVRLSSQLTTPTDAFLTPIADLQMSPKKALRAAMLKSRFADTILKAQQNLLLVHGAKADPVRMQQEKEKLERRLLEERAKIEAQMRAAKAAAKLKAEVGLRKQREKERKAARVALQRMENTAGIELNLEIVKELDILSGCSLSLGNPLHQLGLFIKEYSEDEVNEAGLNEDLEEGEIQL
ncbi:transcription factor GTE12-like [Durio zibethinus]|uniref:Transcription factor GTE12-like n=1 Tax=Durio zibethinus TaxID=66656 RepID=A0A6P6AIG9_DURZI|nr:transcription factor GTE12-like [Durio zibethinus]